jgi:UDP-N-acetylmuramate--alanine ligase
MDEFAAAFKDADSLYLLDIYAANEPPIPGVTAEAVAARITATGTSALYVPSVEDATIRAASNAEPGDMILTLGAGNVSQLGPLVLDRLNLVSPVAATHVTSKLSS